VFDANLHTVSICNWNPINDYIVQNYADFKLNVSSDSAVSAEASTYLSTNDPDMMFLHFDDVDHAGHAYGFSPTVSQYTIAIEGVDALLAPVMQTISNRPNYANEDWLVLITSDHGGVGTSDVQYLRLHEKCQPHHDHL
jgi:predicted AlkP superfamily pyrophosphatase or phosphodiesterase